MNSEFEVIAERVLTIKEGGLERLVSILIGLPYTEADGACFCPYKIVGIGSEKTKSAAGVDTIQALQLVFVRIGAELSNHPGLLSEGHKVSTGFPTSIHGPLFGIDE